MVETLTGSVGKPDERRPLGRPRRKWDDNIKMDLQEVGWGNELDRSGSGQRQVAGCCECGNEPSSFIKLGGGVLDSLRHC
jgi:hypothetical protein